MRERRSDKPPVYCRNCGAEITFAPGQLVGDPDAVAKVKGLLEALETIADPDWASIYPPDVFKETKRIARKALDA